MSRLYLAVVLFIVPATLRAQEAFTPLDSGLTVGETIHVLVDAPCATNACPGELVKGKVAKLSDALLVVDDGRKRHELAAPDVRYIERPRDRIWNGLLAGFVVGFAVGFGSVMLDGCERSHASSTVPRLRRRRGLSAAVSVRASAPSPMP